MIATFVQNTSQQTGKSTHSKQLFGESRSMPFFQPKLTVNTPGDEHEQEADRVADQVMRMREGDAPVVQRMPLTPVGGVQHKCAECEKEVQRKGEENKEEKDMAVQRAPMASSMEEEKGQVQRKCANCEKEENVQRKESGGGAGGHAAPSVVSDVLSSGGGQPMDGGTRQFMESRFGQDFSQVRIHTDSRAAESASAIQARAYTSGRDIVFGQGEYQPDSDSGRRLLAHELVHVRQQGGGEYLVHRKVKVPKGTTLDTKGYTHTKAGDLYSAPKVSKSSVFNEIFTALLASPRIFSLLGSTTAEVNLNFDAHIKARLGILAFASKKQYAFGAGSAFRMNPKYWEKTASGTWQVKKGISSQKALDDLNISPKAYAIACLAATKFTMIGGSGSNLADLPSSDTKDWVPGDWGYITNNNFTGLAKDVGLEGENLIYTGKDLWWGHFTGTNTYRTLSEWFKEVKSWHGKATIENQRTIPATGLI